MKQSLETQITAWKAEHGKIYKSIIDGTDYIWRKLKRKEYVALMADSSEESADPEMKVYDRQETITKLVVLYPENIEELIVENAGLATIIADEVIARSGFNIEATQEL